jgi:hypothetical protein
MPSYRQLDSAQIVRTLEELRDRIESRFPQSNLRRVCEQLLTVSHEVIACVGELRRPNWMLRGAGALAIVGLMALLIAVAHYTVSAPGQMTASDIVQTIEAAVNDVVFFGIAVFFLTTIETRVKRRRALAMIHQLRSFAHIVDMHQLTKDPERLRSRDAQTAPGQPQPTSGADLAKYLDFCSELLSLISKLAALTVQHFNDSVVLVAVDEIESLTTGLSGKIWQKITILERAGTPGMLRISDSAGTVLSK